MADARRVPEAIDWHEGMLLAPQHFQQLSLRNEELLHYHSASLTPFHWGVLRLSIDEAALTQGLLRVSEIEAVLPDGLVVTLDDQPPLEIDLKPYGAALETRKAMVYLAVPARRPGLSPVHGEFPRFRSVEGAPVVDESSGEGDVFIPRLRPCPVLLIAEAPSQRYAALPIARVQRSDDKFSLDESYEPPALVADRGSRFGRIAAQVSERLRKKAEVLSDRAHSHVVVETPQLLETRLMVHGLTGALPRLEAVLATGRAHPYELYLALCDVAGHAAIVGHGLIPPLFQPYDHADPLAAYLRVSDFVLRVAQEGVSESYTPFRFHWDSGAYGLMFDESWRNVPLVMGVRGQAGLTEDEVEEWIAGSLVGSQGLMQDMRDRRVLGARRQRIEAEGDLVPAGGVLLFSLTPDPDFVQPNQELRVWNVGDRGDTPGVIELVLYVKVPR